MFIDRTSKKAEKIKYFGSLPIPDQAKPKRFDFEPNTTLTQ